MSLLLRAVCAGVRRSRSNLPNNSVTRHGESQSPDKASERCYQILDTSPEVDSEKEIDPVWDFKKEKAKTNQKRIPVTPSKHIFKVNLPPTSLPLILLQERSHPS